MEEEIKSSVVPKDLRKGLKSLIILVAWEIWKHRNACVFEKLRLNVQDVIRAVNMECGLWCMAGASKLRNVIQSDCVLTQLAP